MVAVQEQKTEEIKKQTELMKALADANREKEVTNFIIEHSIAFLENQIGSLSLMFYIIFFN